jgi:hypothetical protein
MKLLPVRVSESLPAPLPVERKSADFAKPQPVTIQIELRQAQVRIEGSADPASVRVLLVFGGFQTCLGQFRSRCQTWLM